jgi:hypothetical protein
MAVSSDYQRRLQALRSSSGPSLSVEQANAMRAQAELEAMTPEQRRARYSQQNQPLPVYELGKNIATGETVMTNQPAQTMAERDKRLAQFTKSNPVQGAKLRGDIKPYKGMGTENFEMAQMADEAMFNQPEVPEAPAGSQMPPARKENISVPQLLTDMRYFVSPQFKMPTTPEAGTAMTAPESTEPPAPLSQSLSPEAQAVVAVGQAAKAAGPTAGKTLLRAAELVPGVGGMLTRARMVAAAPEVGKFVAGPGTRAVREIQTRGQEAAPKVAMDLAPMAIRAGVAGARLAPKVGAKIGSVAREVGTYQDLEKQIEERAKRRNLMGELYPLALADERRKAAALLRQGDKIIAQEGKK